MYFCRRPSSNSTFDFNRRSGVLYVFRVEVPWTCRDLLTLPMTAAMTGHSPVTKFITTTTALPTGETQTIEL